MVSRLILSILMFVTPLARAEDAFERRPLIFPKDGFGLCYGPYRAGQQPGGAAPSRAQLREDVRILSKHCEMIRVYGAGHFAGDLLDIIKEEKSSLKVLLGGWLNQEAIYDQEGKLVKTHEGVREKNAMELATLIALADAHRESVVAVLVGNETQVEWSDHRIHPKTLIGHIRDVRSQVAVPVTTGDDFNFWNKDRSREVAAEVDFITIHLYALWNGALMDVALDWTKSEYQSAKNFHPQIPVVVGESGWATSKADTGLQGRLMKEKAGPEQQVKFLEQLFPWLKAEHVPVFYFSAFDEPWKSGEDTAGAEGHWGLFKEDRTSKAAAVRLLELRSE
ncbi:MAG: hypothetical protein KDN22_15630 [Verrucomicrobiae bacterium]|nr:hypothetical protein [Verrucomicrobiae bacterium]